MCSKTNIYSECYVVQSASYDLFFRCMRRHFVIHTHHTHFKAATHKFRYVYVCHLY